jgi:hypothetical protein
VNYGSSLTIAARGKAQIHFYGMDKPELHQPNVN